MLKKLIDHPEIIKIGNQNVCVLSWFNNSRVHELYESQKKVFEQLGITINHYFDESLTHAKFMDYCLKNFVSDIYVFFDLDCIPYNSEFLNVVIDEHDKNDCIIGIEQSSQHVTPNFIYAGPAYFSISKKVYEKINSISFDGIVGRSDVAEEISYSCIENNIKINFFRLISSKNNKWRLGQDRFFGNGSKYEFKGLNIYHQFQTNLEEQRQDFINECNLFIKK